MSEGFQNSGDERKPLQESGLQGTSAPEGERHVLENINEGYIELDDEFRFRYVNAAAEDLFGMSRDALLGQYALRMFPPADETLGAFERALVDRESTTLHDYSESIEAWLETRVFPAETGIKVYLRDVTENYEQREALRRSEERFRLLSAATNDTIWEWDLETNQISWGASVEKLTGFSPEELAAPADWARRVHSEDFGRVIEGLQLVRSSDSHAWHEEYRFIHAQGHVIVVAVHGELQCDANGVPKRFIGGLIDVTERRRLEARLVRADRLETLGRLASSVAHDMNNLLAPISFSVTMLKQGETDPERLEDIDIIETCAERGANLTRRLLNFARGDEGEEALVDIGEVATEVHRILAATFPGSIEFQLELEADLPRAICDPGQIHQVITNLALNARDAMPAGGSLTLAVGSCNVDDSSRKPAGQYVEICVRDTGVGIPEDKIETIFEPFYSTKPTGEGTGLGLATVETIVTAHGGYIDVESGEETTFRILLPASDSAANREEGDKE